MCRLQGRGVFDAVIDISQGKGEEHWSRVTCNPLDQIAIDNLGNFPRLISLDFTASEMRGNLHGNFGYFRHISTKIDVLNR